MSEWKRKRKRKATGGSDNTPSIIKGGGMRFNGGVLHGSDKVV